MGKMKCCLRNLVLILSVIYVVVDSASGYGYSKDPNKGAYKNTNNKDFMPPQFSVQGIVYCKSSSNKLSPLKGGVIRIACLGIDKYGYETAPFSVLTKPTDGNGYFLTKLSSKPLLENDGNGDGDGVKISKCKAFLHSAPLLKSCPFPTDVNKGSTGAPISAYRAVNGARLYSVGPFVYSSQPQKIPPSPY
ncbi:hypothetical protein ABFS83_04G011900 [Erythranthe nasuta]